jgi:hypothetical protein
MGALLWLMVFPAARAYKQALATLATLTALPSSRAFEHTTHFRGPREIPYFRLSP